MSNWAIKQFYEVVMIVEPTAVYEFVGVTN